MDVVSRQKEYDEINVWLSVLHEEADSIMTENKDASLLKKTLNELKMPTFPCNISLLKR